MGFVQFQFEFVFGYIFEVIFIIIGNPFCLCNQMHTENRAIEKPSNWWHLKCLAIAMPIYSSSHLACLYISNFDVC